MLLQSLCVYIHRDIYHVVLSRMFADLSSSYAEVILSLNSHLLDERRMNINLLGLFHITVVRVYRRRMTTTSTRRVSGDHIRKKMEFIHHQMA